MVVLQQFQVLAERATHIEFCQLGPGLTVTLQALAAITDLHTEVTAALPVCRLQGSLGVSTHLVSEFTSAQTGLFFVLSWSFYFSTNYLYYEDLFSFVFKLTGH